MAHGNKPLLHLRLPQRPKLRLKGYVRFAIYASLAILLSVSQKGWAALLQCTPSCDLQAMHMQLVEERQLRHAGEEGCRAAQADAQAAHQAAADGESAAKAAAMEAERRAAEAAKAVDQAETAAAVAAAQRQQAEQASDLFQRRLHEVQAQVRVQQQQERALRAKVAKVCLGVSIKARASFLNHPAHPSSIWRADLGSSLQ